MAQRGRYASIYDITDDICEKAGNIRREYLYFPTTLVHVCNLFYLVSLFNRIILPFACVLPSHQMINSWARSGQVLPSQQGREMTMTVTTSLLGQGIGMSVRMPSIFYMYC